MQLAELTSRQCNDYQVQGGDIVLVPVGSVEARGPHLPMGARCFVAEAFCALLAEKVGGLCLPVTPFSSVAHTFDRPGSVDVPETTLNAYLRALMDDLIATGFRRILLVTYLDYLRYYIPQEVYEDHQVAAAGIHLEEEFHRVEGDLGIGEDSIALGALRVLGRDDLAAKIEEAHRRLRERGDEKPPALSEALQALRQVGAIGFVYPPGAYPAPPGPSLSGEKGEQALRQAVERLAPAVESLCEYNAHLALRRASRGFGWRGWRG